MQPEPTLWPTYITLAFTGIVALGAIVQIFLAIRMKKYAEKQSDASELMAAFSAYTVRNQEYLEYFRSLDQKFDSAMTEYRELAKELYEFEVPFADNPDEYTNAHIKLLTGLQKQAQKQVTFARKELKGDTIHELEQNRMHSQDRLLSVIARLDSLPTHHPPLQSLRDFHARLRWLITGR